MKDRRGILAEDLYQLKSVTDPRISPDEKKVAYVETSISKETDDYVSNLFVYDLEKNKSQQWTYGNKKNRSPRWSPDGTKLAFVSNRSGHNQLYIVDVQGGEARQFTNLKNGVSNPVWSPDGTKIAFHVQLTAGESLEEVTKEDKAENNNKLEPLEVERMKYKSNGSGFFTGNYQQIAVIDIATAEIVLLTNGEIHHSLECYSPDGRSIIIGTDEAENPDLSFKQDLYILHTETKEKEKITSGQGYFYDATFSPNGKFISIMVSGREYENATLTKVYIYDVERKEFNNLSQDWNVQVGDVVAADFLQGVVTPSALWSEDNQGVYFTASYLGNVNVYFSDLKGNIEEVTHELGHVYGLTISKSGKAFATISYPTLPSDLFEVSLQNGEVKPLTAINQAFLETVTLTAPEPLQFISKDGTTLHGWLLKPVGFEEGEKYPFILEIHGGPHAMYANTYFHEFQQLAASGYIILYTNPRGSHGYGQAFVDAVRGDYGGKDYDDLMAAIDYAIDTYDYIDTTRLGVTGGSYGGFMTNWIVGHTNRFKAAVTQRSISNWISFYGVSDIGYYFNEWQHKLDVTDIEGLWKISPLAYIDFVQTPLLILHSEKDYRCPIEQAEQLFIGLKHRGKETKFIRFPESNHDLSRNGIPSLRVKRLDYIHNWFKQHLQ